MCIEAIWDVIMKILYVVSGFAPAWGLGGGVKASYELSKEMALRVQEVTVYTTDIFDYNNRINYNFKNWDGVNTYYFKAMSNFLAKKQFNFSLNLIYLLYKNVKNFDLIHIHEYRTINGTFAAYFAKKNGIPYIIQPHGSLPSIIGRKRLKKVYDFVFGNNVLQNASKVIALNDMESEQYKNMGVDSKKIRTIPNGIDISQYNSLPPKGSFKLKHGINDDEKIILFLGRINIIKGINLLVDAFEKLTHEFSNVRLVIAGPDNGYLSSLKKQISVLKIEKHVLFTGPLYEQDKLEAYVDADVYVLPSVYEIFGITILEACACGTPVIVTDRCGISDFVENVGYVVEYDKEQLMDALFKILSNKEVRLKLGEEGKKLVRKEFKWDDIAKQIERIYKDVAK